MTGGDDLAKRLKAHVSRPLPKRFYKEVAVTGDAPPLAIALDGRPVRTPMKAALALPTRALAEAVAREWRAQGKSIDPRAMPMTRLSNTAIDRVAGDRERIVGEIAAYTGSDLLCYRAEEPEGLVERQAEVWDPIVAWAEDVLGGRFILVAGVVHRPQSDAVLEAFRARLHAFNAFELTALHEMASLTGSALLALAVAVGRLGADEAWAAAHLDEDWQIAQWGPDTEAQARRAARKADFDAAVDFLAMSRLE
ncbi:MAG: ATP12 family chaperone protein [Parvibaculaceae bacterium]